MTGCLATGPFLSDFAQQMRALAWVGKIMTPVFKRQHNRPIKATLQKKQK